MGCKHNILETELYYKDKDIVPQSPPTQGFLNQTDSLYNEHQPDQQLVYVP